MLIDRYTRVVTDRDPTRSEVQTKARRINFSLPRVRWLERDPDFVPPGEIVPGDVFAQNADQAQGDGA